MTIRTDVLIVGGGPAGISAAIWCKRLGIPHLVVERKSRMGGQLEVIHNRIVDYPGLVAENGEALREMMERHFREMACACRLETDVVSVDPARRRAIVAAPGQERTEIAYRALILATGASDRRLGIPGEEAMRARGEIYSTTRDRHRFADKRVAVVGGGDRAFEGAWLLAESGAEVLLIHRSDRFRAREELVGPVLVHPRIRIRKHALVTAILGERRTEAVEVRSADGSVERIGVEAVFVRIGVEANSGLLRPFVPTEPDGRIVVGEAGITSLACHYAVGDVATAPLYTSLLTATGQAMAAVKHYLHHAAAPRSTDTAGDRLP